jgi:hypothetical protein
VKSEVFVLIDEQVEEPVPDALIKEHHKTLRGDNVMHDTEEMFYIIFRNVTMAKDMAFDQKEHRGIDVAS